MMLQILLFFHLLGVVLLFGGNILTIIAHARLTRATTLAAVRAATVNFSLIGPFMGAGALLVIVMGIAMVYVGGFGWSLPWINTAFVIAIILAIVGPLISGKRGNALLEAVAKAGDGPIPPDIEARIHDRLWNYAAFLTTCELIALLFIMTVKPGLTVCIVAILLAALIAAIPVLTMKTSTALSS
jgi:hypothetical protein